MWLYSLIFVIATMVLPAHRVHGHGMPHTADIQAPTFGPNINQPPAGSYVFSSIVPKSTRLFPSSMASINAINEDILPPPVTVSAKAETAQLTAQVIDIGTIEKDRITETVKSDGGATPEDKQVPQAGLENYFVSGSIYAYLSVHCS